MKRIFYLLSVFLLGIALSFTPVKKKVIVIDAGHGGQDFGTKRENVNEKDITLSIAVKIQELAKKSDKFEVILTRDTDVFPSLVERNDKINEISPDYVISLHMNGTPNKSVKGHEVYIQTNNEQSKLLAEKIASKFNSKILERNLHILNNSKSPAVLVELGFMSNDEDREYLASKNGQNEVAKKFIELFNEF